MVTKSTDPDLAPVAVAIAPRTIKRPLWRRIGRIAAIALASLVALVVIGLVFLQTPWGKSFVRGRIEQRLAAKLNGSVRVGSIDYSFLFREIRLGDVEISDAAGRPAIGAGSIAVVIDRGSLLAGAPVIDDLAIRGLDVSVVQSADGRSNLTGLFKKSTGKPLDRIRVSRLAVAGTARVVKSDGTVIAVESFGLGGTVDARPAAREIDAALTTIAAKVSISPPTMATRNVDLAIASVAVGRRADAVDVDVRDIEVGALAIESLGARIRLAGKQLRGHQTIDVSGVRVDDDQLAALLGRELLIDDLAIDVAISGPDNALVLDGTVRTGVATLDLDGTIDASAPSRPTYRLALVGRNLRSDVIETNVPAIATGLRIDVAGSGTDPADLDADLAIAIGRTTIGALAVDGVELVATASHGAYAIERFHADALGMALDATATLASDKAVNGRVDVRGNPAAAAKRLAAAGIRLPKSALVPSRLALAVTATGNLDGTVAVDLAKTRVPLAGGAITIAGSARLEHRKLDRARATIDLRTIDLGTLAALAGRKPTLHGTLSGTVAVDRTATSRRADYDLAIALRDKPIDVIARGRAGATSVAAHVDAVRRGDRSVLATIDATVPLRRTAPWTVDVDVARRSLAEVAALLPPRLRGKLPAAASAEIHVDLAGTPVRPTGTLTVALDRGDQRVDLRGTVSSIGDAIAIATSGAIVVDPSQRALALVNGTVALPSPYAGGSLDFAAARAGATVDATIDIPDRAVASLASLRPTLARIDGALGGTIAVDGPLARPAIDASLRWHGYRTATGATAATTITARGTPLRLTAAIDHAGAVAITADIDRRTAGRVDIDARIRADDEKLLPIVPAFVAGKLRGADLGRLRWNMDAKLALVRGALAEAAVTGTLDVDGGAIAIPNSNRRYHDIDLAVAGEPGRIAIRSLVVHESDVEKRDRRLAASGTVTLDKLKPSALHLDLEATDWLVFGTPTLGAADAPRATADFDIGVDVDLAAPILGVDATIRSLALDWPDRLDRGHQPEAASVSGDIIYLDRVADRAGKLPVSAPAVAGAPRKRRPVDIRIHIPRPIRVEQPPISVMATGDLVVAIRDTGTTTRGALAIDSGMLNLFGRDHRLVDGSLEFSDEHPRGWLSLTFERHLPPHVIRELSRASAGGGARVTFSGSPTSKPKTTLSGAANAALVEVMAMHNAGRPTAVTRPGMPATATVQAPRGDQLAMLTFMASNLPHLLFLDRITAWSGNAYGRIENVEAEKYGRRSRVRAVVRPRTPGRSTAEVQLDRMLVNDDGAALGVGVRAGNRLGGGVGVFVEWSSDD